MDHHDNHNTANLPHGGPYGFYPTTEQEANFDMVYPPQGINNYSVVPAAPPAQLQQAFQMRPMGLMANTHHPQYDSGHEFSSSPQAQSAGLMMEAGPPPSPDISTSSSRANSLVHRNPLRYNPTPSPSGSSGRRSRGRSFGDSDEDMGVNIAESIAYTRKEATRRQRIEAEQRRRDELRDGYARLKDVLPVSNQKSSKVSLLERATNHIVQLEKLNQQLQKKIQGLNAEIARLQNLNEKISLNNTNTPSPGVSMGVDSRPLSPPPETSNLSQLTSVSGQEPPREDSPPSSDGDF
ncbi:hypothetical protein EDB89DRAFT_2063761 [Lactarius sanguifluus]|nr:hypothetical protein EDB89DRAFT_2063761 [Lactarius sanguifluus]